MEGHKKIRVEQIKDIYSESLSLLFIELLSDIENLIEKVNSISDYKSQDLKEPETISNVNHKYEMSSY